MDVQAKYSDYVPQTFWKAFSEQAPPVNSVLSEHSADIFLSMAFYIFDISFLKYCEQQLNILRWLAPWEADVAAPTWTHLNTKVFLSLSILFWDGFPVSSSEMARKRLKITSLERDPLTYLVFKIHNTVSQHEIFLPLLWLSCEVFKRATSTHQ